MKRLKKTLPAAMLALTAIFSSAALGEETERVDGLNLVESGTEYSKHIADLQKRFGNAKDGTKIVIFDQDWFNLNKAVNAPPDIQTDYDPEEEDYDLYDTDVSGGYVSYQLLKEFVEKRTGQDIESYRLYGIQEKAGNSYGTTFINKGDNDNLKPGEKPKTSLCFIFAHRANMDSEFQNRLMIGLNPYKHGPLASLVFRQNIDMELLNKYTDYHEVGHCLDRWYSAEDYDFQDNPEKYLENRHRAEMFGEIFATFMLAKDGHINIAESRAAYRLASMAIGGSRSIDIRNKSDKFYYSGYMYMIHDGLRATQKVIDNMTPLELQNITTEQALLLAHKITEANAIDVKTGMEVLTYILENNFDLSDWEKRRKSSSVIDRKYKLAKKYISNMEEAIKAVFEVDHLTTGPLLPQVINISDQSAEILPPKNKSEKAHKKRYMTENELAAVLLADFRGEDASLDTLVKSITEFKNNMRHDLENGTGKERRRAMIYLMMMPDAMIAALRVLENQSIEPFLAANLPAKPNYLKEKAPTRIIITDKYQPD